MTVFSNLSFKEISRLRKFVQREHLKSFGVELPRVQVDQFIESYWGDFMEKELQKAVDSGLE
jgi:hypothetical protein